MRWARLDVQAVQNNKYNLVAVQVSISNKNKFKRVEPDKTSIPESISATNPPNPVICSILQWSRELGQRPAANHLPAQTTLINFSPNCFCKTNKEYQMKMSKY